MTGGSDLLGAPIEAPRKRGRPKGSTNKRARDLKGFIDGRYGASAAQQSAALCMVTPSELKAAGGSMAKAVVDKAGCLVELVRVAQAQRDVEFRQVIRDEFERLLLDVRDVTAKELRASLDQALKRVKEAGAGFTLREALDLMTKERQALMPYTDQRQPLAVEAKGSGFAPSVVVMGALGEVFGVAGPPVVDATDADFTEVFGPPPDHVAQALSHDDAQPVD